MAYSSAFLSTTSDRNTASAAYSEAYAATARRKWPRDKKYKEKLGVISAMARRNIGLEKPD